MWTPFSESSINLTLSSPHSRITAGATKPLYLLRPPSALRALGLLWTSNSMGVHSTERMIMGFKMILTFVSSSLRKRKDRQWTKICR